MGIDRAKVRAKVEAIGQAKAASGPKSVRLEEECVKARTTGELWAAAGKFERYLFRRLKRGRLRAGRRQVREEACFKPGEWFRLMRVLAYIDYHTFKHRAHIVNVADDTHLDVAAWERMRCWSRHRAKWEVMPTMEELEQIEEALGKRLNGHRQLIENGLIHWPANEMPYPTG